MGIPGKKEVQEKKKVGFGGGLRDFTHAIRGQDVVCYCSSSAGGLQVLIVPSKRPRLFSSQEYSMITSLAGLILQVLTFIQSCVKVFGSCTVTVCWMVLESVRRNVLMNLTSLLWG